MAKKTSVGVRIPKQAFDYISEVSDPFNIEFKSWLDQFTLEKKGRGISAYNPNCEVADKFWIESNPIFTVLYLLYKELKTRYDGGDRSINMAYYYWFKTEMSSRVEV